MAVRVGVVLHLVALSSFLAARGTGGGMWDGKVRDLIDDGEEMTTESGSSWRTVAKATGKFISYSAMRQGNIPCGLRGASYYACDAHGQANPYKRGCSKIGRCAKNTK